eukprot:gene10796-7685_t
MKALLERQQAAEQFRQKMKEAGDNPDRTVEERVDHCKHLQYEEHQQLFAVGYTTIHKAAADNSLSGLKFFLSLRGHKKINKNALDHHGMSALHHAAEKGHVDSIRFLVSDAGMKVNLRSSYGNTPLMLAVKENRVDAIKVLCELNADITLENHCGYTCFHFAAESNRAAAVRAIGDVAKADGNLPLFQLDLQSSKKIAAAEVEKPTTLFSSRGGKLLTKTINHKARNGHTALHLAAQQVCLEVAEVLLEFGADVNARDNNLETPMHKAGRRTTHVMYQLLKNHHGDERIQNAFHQTPRDLLYDNVKF